MTLSDLVKRNQLLEIRCGDCRKKTPVDPDFFLTRRGDVPIGELMDSLVCPGCGSDDIELGIIPSDRMDEPTDT